MPDDLNEVIAAYLEKHDRHDDAASDRLNNELISIYQKHVADHPDKYAAFLALLRPLRQAIRTSAWAVQWWDRLVEPVLEHMSRERGLAKEALTNIHELLSFQEGDYDGSNSDEPNVFADRLLSRWMQLHEMAQVGGNSATELSETVIRDAITMFGKNDPKVSVDAAGGWETLLLQSLLTASPGIHDSPRRLRRQERLP